MYMPHIELAAEKLFILFGIPITNALLTGWVVVLVLTIVAILVSRRIALIPGTLQSIWEMMIEGFLGFMEGIYGSRANAERYFPIIGAIFFFIITSNWLGILPGVGSIEFEAHGAHLPLFRSAASDLNFTLALGISAMALVNWSGMRALGIGSHFSKFFTLKNPIATFVGLLEFISEFAKIISFSFRLFGNIFAGEVLLTIIAFVAGILTPAAVGSAQSLIMAGALMPFLGLEIFVGLVQALVFAMLTMVFISISIAHHDESPAHEHVK